MNLRRKDTLIFAFLLLILTILFSYLFWANQHDDNVVENQSDSVENVETPNYRTASPITVTIAGEALDANLFDNQAAQELEKELPITMTFRDFGPSLEEKIGDLSEELSTEGMSSGEDPEPGDIGYWSPQPRVVLYWGDVSYYEGIHRIGRFEDVKKASQLIENQEDDFEVTIEITH